MARKRPEELSLEEWHRVMSVNIDGVFVACQAAFPHLRRRTRWTV